MSAYRYAPGAGGSGVMGSGAPPRSDNRCSRWSVQFEKYSQPSSMSHAPPPYSCTRVRALNPSLSRSRSEEHTSELQSLMRNSYAVFCLKQKNQTTRKQNQDRNTTYE